MPRPPTPSGSRGRRLVWLFDLTLAGSGETLRLSEEGMGAPTPGGETVFYRAGLAAPEYSESLDLFSSGPSERSISVSVFPDVACRPGREGWEGSRGILRLWVEGTDEYAVWMDGDVRRTEWGGPGEPVDLDLSEDTYLDAGALPPSPSARVTVETWTTYSSRVEGIWYPLVFGSPGGVFGGMATTASPATPALLIDTVGDGGVTCDSRALVSLFKVAATSVLLTDLTTGAQDECGVVSAVDGQGNLVSLALLDSAGNIMSHGAYDSETAELWAGWWSSANGNQLGICDGTGRGIQGMGQVMEFALRFSSRRIDWGSLKSVGSLLNSLAVDGCISVSEPVTPWAWVAETLLPLAPVGVTLSPEGVGLTPWRYDALPAEAEFVLEAACVDPDTGEWVLGNGERLGRVLSSDAADLKNEIHLKFQRLTGENRYLTESTATGDPLRRNEGEALNPWCRRARSRYLSRGMEVTRRHDVVADLVWDTGSAEAVLGFLARRWATLPQRASYHVRDGASHLRLGAVILLTDLELGLESVVVRLEKRVWRMDGSQVLTVLWA